MDHSPSPTEGLVSCTLTEAQFEVWIAQQLDPHTPRYNCAAQLHVHSDLHVPWLEQAIRLTLQEAEALRVRFIGRNPQEVRQVVYPTPEQVLEFMDLQDLKDPVAHMQHWVQQDLGTAQPLQDGQLLRQVCFQLAPRHFVYHLRYHHILMDGYGQSVYWKRVSEHYTALANQKTPPGFHGVPLSEVLHEEATYLQSEQATLDQNFWQDLFADQPEIAVLSAQPPQGPSRGLLRQVSHFDPQLRQGLQDFTTLAKTRWSTVLLAATAVYLYRTTGQSDVFMVLPMPGRTSRKTLSTPAMLTNSLPLRLHLTPDMSLENLLEHIHRALGKLLRHQRHRGERLLRQQDTQQLGTAVVNVVSFDQKLEWAGVQAEPHYLSSGPVPDLQLGFYGQADLSDLQLHLDANPDRHSALDLLDHQRHLMQAISSLLDLPLQAPISQVDLLLPEEKKALQGWHDTCVPYDLTRTLHAHLDQQAELTPELPAVSTRSQTLSYRQVKDQSDRLAAFLQQQGVGVGDRVAVCQSRSIHLPVVLLGILKAGAAFVPLDPELPPLRLKQLLQGADVKALLIDDSAPFPFWERGTVPFWHASELLAELPQSIPLAVGSPDNAAYVLYTSGSTGAPKAVVVTHRGVVNRLLWMQDAYGLTVQDVVLQKTPFTFDVSMWEFFWPLMTGARLHMAEPGIHRDPRQLAQVMQEQNVTTLHFVPPMLDAFLQDVAAQPSMEFKHLKRVVCSGEALRPETVGRFFQCFDEQKVHLYNLYGPTEASIDVTHWTCSPTDAVNGVPIGHPVANTRILLLDVTGQEVPVGRVGELHIAGVQVAAGYLNQPELTRERFDTDPVTGEAVYRTGDLARRRQDGAIEYLGRMDHQVKLRGLRIEPAEVDSALLTHHQVTQALTVLQNQPQPQLVSYLTLQEGSAVTSQELLAHLAGRLPQYMVPSSVVVLPAFPMLSNGKMDRKALPLPQVKQDSSLPESLTPLQQQVAQAWQEVLGVQPALQDSFFQLGGDSLTSIRLRSALERQGLTFALRDLFTHPTLQALTECVTPLDTTAGTSTQNREPFALLSATDRAKLPAGLEDAYPLSAMQRGMVFQAEKAPDSGVYRVVTSVQVTCPYDAQAMKRAIQDTTARHPILRASVDLTSFSVPVHLVHPEVDVPLHTSDELLNQSPEAQQQALEAWMAKAKTTRFEMSQAPLMRFQVHLRSEHCFQLSVIEHHVILDGWSDAAMLDEILMRYQAYLQGQHLWLPALPCRHRDFVALEQEAIHDPTSREHWMTHLSGAESSLLPQRSQTLPLQHQAFEVDVPEALSQQLLAVARKWGLPLKSVLAAAHLTVLAVVCASHEVLTGLVVHGRPETEAGDQVLGVFLNTLPLRVPLHPEMTFLDAMEAVKQFEQQAWPHRRFPISEMQQAASSPFELDSYLNFIDFHDHLQQQKHAHIQGGMGVAETNFPLAVNFLMDPNLGHLRAWLDCNTGLLDEAFCIRLAGYYTRALQALVADPTQPILEVDLLSSMEKTTLQLWNDTAQSHDRTATLHQLIEQQVQRTPHHAAVSSQNHTLTYFELNRQANRLAHHLIQRGVGPGHKVGVYMRRSTQMVVGLLGILKAGAAYVPLDPSFPLGRLEFIAQDAGMSFLLADQTVPGGLSAQVKGVLGCSGWAEDLDHDPQPRAVALDTAYVIYTSGSTGLPKGTILRHENVTNFCEGMNHTVGCDEHDTVLAVTSISFDISVLELLWPLTRGAHVVVAGEQLLERLTIPEKPEPELDFSLFFFAAATRDQDRQEGYRLVLEAARFADQHGFTAIWTPERHFHDFGGLFPNPSVMSAALAAITQNVKLRSGSVVAPLHDPVRLAEEWALVDNLSAGRVGLAFASGWNANDFALAPENYGDRKQVMNNQLQQFRQLWKGQSIERTNGRGETLQVRIFPTPVQEDVELWFTSSGSVDTFRRAGEAGVHVLTHLLGQDLTELGEKIRAYRESRTTAGYATPGKVTLMIHTFLHEDEAEARRLAREPFKAYLRTSTELWAQLFASMNLDVQGDLNPQDMESMLDLAVERYFERSGLFGSPASVMPLVRDLMHLGVDELACLIDFGVPTDQALQGLQSLNALREQQAHQARGSAFSLEALCQKHPVTLFQSTPSFLSAVAAEPKALQALQGTRAVLVGGEAFPSGLAGRLMDALPDTQLWNMYGPTETTIWSTVHLLTPTDRHATSIPIGRPIANTQVRVLDTVGRDVPADVPGELWIGGEGVASGYLNRETMTQEKFVAFPAGQVFYRTGDRVRWRKDGTLEFYGRVDRQVKIRGHRVEPDEVESVLSRHPALESVAVVASDQGQGLELLAFLTENPSKSQPALEDAVVDRWSEVWDAAYREPGVHQAPDFSGWKSSFTDQPIPEPEMQEWLNHTLQRLQDLNPTRMLEVGVGVGLILKGMLPHVQHYTGLDVSPSALQRAWLGVQHLGHEAPQKVTLLQGDARLLGHHQLETPAPDVVVLNSVVQYFPSAGYLQEVLHQAFSLLPDSGQVFVGDVRHLHALEAFHASVECHKADVLTPVGELLRKVKRKVQDEQELCLTPAFFQHMQHQLGAQGLKLQPKRGLFDNELTVYRFDATLSKTAGSIPEVPALPHRYTSMQDLKNLLKGHTSHSLRITGIPNLRFLKPLARVRLLHTLPADTPLWELERQLWCQTHPASQSNGILHPETVLTWAQDMGARAEILLSEDGSLNAFDVLWHPTCVKAAEDTDSILEAHHA